MSKEKHAPVKQDDKQDVLREKTVKVLSLRSGDVVLQDGTVLKYRQVVDVSPEIADWLVGSFKDLMLKV